MSAASSSQSQSHTSKPSQAARLRARKQAQRSSSKGSDSPDVFGSSSTSTVATASASATGTASGALLSEILDFATQLKQNIAKIDIPTRLKSAISNGSESTVASSKDNSGRPLVVTAPETVIDVEKVPTPTRRHYHLLPEHSLIVREDISKYKKQNGGDHDGGTIGVAQLGGAPFFGNECDVLRERNLSAAAGETGSGEREGSALAAQRRI